MSFTGRDKFRKVLLSGGGDDSETVSVNINHNKRSRDCSPCGAVLKNSSSANVTPTKISISNNANFAGLDGGNGNDREYIIGSKKEVVHKDDKNDDKEERMMKPMMKVESTPVSTPVKSRSQQQLPLSLFRDIHDLTKLECITMENVLECLRERYRSHQCYTYAGPVLLSLNSCLKLPRASLIEDVTKMSWYFIDDAKRQDKENELKSSKSPHVYDIGYQSLRNLVTVGAHQIILISGESGAGKTTATQQLIKYLTENNSRNFGANICSNLDKKIYFATLILESFGNAKTQANPNSSRFGRLVQLNYGKGTGQIMGAEIQTYLLEKHRVAKYDFRSERNFHIIYYILHGLRFGTIQTGVSWENAKQLFQEDLLTDALECDNEEIKRLLNAIQAFNMTDFPEMVKVLLAIIALLSVVFVPECDTSSDEDHFSSGLESPYKTEFTVSDKKCTHAAASLLGIADTELVDILKARKITAGNSTRYSIFRKPCENIRECEERLHALTSFIYDRLFSFVLDHLNFNLKGVSSHESEDFSTLSLLDLYGFENFHVNHLEQICINYANERLQQMNVSIVKSYYEQSIPPDEVMIPPTELIRIEAELKQRVEELHTHVFAFFDEECLLKRSTEDKNILDRMSKNLADKKSNFIRTSRKHEQGYKFTITHYATKVEYQLTDLVQKNKDHIPPEFQDILRSSTNCFVHTLFKNDLIRSRNLSGANAKATTPNSLRRVNSNKNTRGKTILTRFKQSVEELMIRLKSSENKDVHFVRCIKPNPNLLAGTFSMDVVEKQLHACGIADVVKIAGNGYPIRLYTKKFITEFPKVLYNFCNGELDIKKLTTIFSIIKTGSIKFGTTMVFMSEQCWKTFKKTEKFLTLHNTRIIQKAWKNHLEQKELLRLTINHPSCNSTMIHKSESFLQTAEDDIRIDNEVSAPENREAEVSPDVVDFAQIKRIISHNRPPPPPLYYGFGIASRSPVHTLPIKFYVKKTCLPFAEKRPQRLLPNGIQDAFEDYEIVLCET